MPTYYVGPKRVYTLTEEDKLWLARAMAGEAGENPKSLEGHTCVAWAMINRFLLSPGQKTWSTLTELLRAFCQPINPTWARGGSKCNPPASEAAAALCTEKHFQRRERISSLPWNAIDADIRTLVDAFAAGAVFMPEKVLELNHHRLSNWAAYRVKQPLGYSDINVGDNWFFEDKNLLPCDVKVITADSPPAPECLPVSKGLNGGWSTTTTFGVIVGLGVLGIAAYLAWARTHS
jgi:hypothetical protein